MEQKNKGGFFYLLKIAYRNLFRNIRRSILCLSAISLAVLLIIFTMCYIEGMLDSGIKIAQTFDFGHIKITTKEFKDKEYFYPLQYPINDMDVIIDKIKKIDGIKAVNPRIVTFATFTNSNVKHGMVAGVNFESINNMKNEKIKFAYYNYTKKSNGLLTGRFPDGDKNECVIGYRLAKKMEIIPTVLEYNEFDWISDNIENEDDKNLLKDIYHLDNQLMIYKLNLFKNDDINLTKISRKELKNLLNIEKTSYLKLLEIFINLKIKNIPEKIGKSSDIVDYIFIKNYQEELFLDMYTLEGNNYIIKNNIDDAEKEEFLDILNSGATLRIPFKIISSQYSDKYYQPKLVGIFEYDYADVDQNYILIPFNKLQSLGSLNDKTQSIFVFVNNNNNYNNLKKNKNEIINALNDPDIIIKDWNESPLIAVFRQFDLTYNIIYSVFIIVASFLIINTIIMVIHERSKEIGMMGTLGMNRIEIVLVFFLEALLLSIFGALIGTILGGIISGIWSFIPINFEAITGGVDFPVTNTIFIKFSFLILIKGFLFGTIVSSICTIFPSLKSAFIEPVEALRR